MFWSPFVGIFPMDKTPVVGSVVAALVVLVLVVLELAVSASAEVLVFLSVKVLVFLSVKVLVILSVKVLVAAALVLGMVLGMVLVKELDNCSSWVACLRRPRNPSTPLLLSPNLCIYQARKTCNSFPYDPDYP